MSLFCSAKFIAAAAFVSAAFSISAGTLYVDDNFRVYKYTPAGAQSVFSTSTGTSDIGMAFGPNGTLYVASRDANAIYSYSANGTRSLFATVQSPYGLAVDASGNVYTGANFGSQILKFNSSGVSSVFATGTNAQSFTVDANGNLFEGDGTGHVYEYTPGGTRTTFASGLGGAQFGLAFDNAGDLLVNDWSAGVVEFAPGGGRSTFATFDSSQLPVSMAYDHSTGTLYVGEVRAGVSNFGEQVVYSYNSSGVRTTFATGLFTPFGLAMLETSGVPEPATWALFGTALLLIGLKRRQVMRSATTPTIAMVAHSSANQSPHRV